MSVPQESYDEIVDLFARTSSAEVLAFRPSSESQERVHYLLERNEDGELTEDEAAELERIRRAGASDAAREGTRSILHGE